MVRLTSHGQSPCSTVRALSCCWGPEAQASVRGGQRHQSSTVSTDQLNAAPTGPAAEVNHPTAVPEAQRSNKILKHQLVSPEPMGLGDEEERRRLDPQEREGENGGGHLKPLSGSQVVLYDTRAGGLRLPGHALPGHALSSHALLQLQ